MRITRWCYRYPAVSTFVAVLLLTFALAISDTPTVALIVAVIATGCLVAAASQIDA
jgi:hypothetical protein